LKAWLGVFRQCSMDPLGKPLVIIPEDTLDSQPSLQDVATLMVDKLSATRVTFIEAWVQRKSKTQDISTKEERSWFGIEQCEFGITYGGRCVGVADADEEQDMRAHEEAALREAALRIQSVHRGNQVRKKDMRAHGEAALRIQSVHRGNQVRKKDSDVEDVETFPDESEAPTYPVDVRLGYVRLTVLSVTHWMLLATFLLGVVVILLQWAMGHIARSIIAIFMELALAVMLYKTEDLEETALLQLEAIRLKQAAKKIRKDRGRLDSFYNGLQRLGNLWRYRTLPCLEVCQELYMVLLQSKERVALLKDMAKSWTRTLEGIGDVALWFEEGGVSDQFLK